MGAEPKAGDGSTKPARAASSFVGSVAANANSTATTRPAPIESTEVTAKQSGASRDAKQNVLSPFARLDRTAHNGLRASHRPGQGEAPPHVDPARFVSRVARAVHTAQERGGPLHLRLSPPELGALRLELTVHQGALTAKIETDNATARHVLLDNLPALRDRLADQNVRVERFDVDVRQDSGGSQHNPGPQDRGAQHRQPPARNPGPSQRHAAASQTVDESAPIRRTITQTSINVVA